MLRFVDPELERAYQKADQVEGVRRARTASLIAAGVWILVAIVGPPAVGVAAGSTWLIAGAMTAFLFVCAGASRWATTQGRRSMIGLGQQVAAAVASLRTQSQPPDEIIVVDNGAPEGAPLDGAADLRGLKIECAATNVGFGARCNAGVIRRL